MEVFGIVITMLLVIIGLIRKKSRKVFYVQWIWIWIIQAFNCGGNDYAMNELIYKYGGEPTEWLSYIIIKLFNSQDIDYIWYRVMWATISIIIVGYIILKYSEKPCCIMLLYCFFMMADNVAQCRFFWAYSIVLLAYHFLIKEKKLHCLIFLIIATGIHSSAFLFLLMPLIYIFIKRNSLIKNGVILGVEFLVFPKLSIILDTIGLTYVASKLNTYLNNDNYSSIIVGICFLFMYSIMIVLSSYVIKHNYKRSDIEQFSYQMNKSAVFILPTLLFNSNFGRFLRPILLISYIALSNRIDKVKHRTLTHTCLLTFFVLTILTGLVLQSRANWFAIDTLFRNNYLFQLVF